MPKYHKIFKITLIVYSQNIFVEKFYMVYKLAGAARENSRIHLRKCERIKKLSKV